MPHHTSSTNLQYLLYACASSADAVDLRECCNLFRNRSNQMMLLSFLRRKLHLEKLQRLTVGECSCVGCSAIDRIAPGDALELTGADVNGDDGVDYIKAHLSMRLAVGYIDIFPAKKRK